MKRLIPMILVIAALFTIVTGCSSKSTEAKDNKLVIGIDDKFAPMGFRDENNKIVGFDIDYAKAAAKRWGRRLSSSQSIGEQKKLS